MNVTINHPTNRDNFTEVTVGEVTVWFSYKTAVGFIAPGWGRVCRVNEWGPTTGKHLNYIGGPRVDSEAFQAMLDEALAGRLPAQTLLETQAETVAALKDAAGIH